MSHAFTCALQRPHEAFNFPLSVGKRLFRFRRAGWMGVFIGVTIITLGAYIYQVNAAAEQGFEMRQLEKRLNTLQISVADLENQAASMQTMQSLQARMSDLGYVAVTRVEYIDAARGAYALAK